VYRQRLVSALPGIAGGSHDRAALRV